MTSDRYSKSSDQPPEARKRMLRADAQRNRDAVVRTAIDMFQKQGVETPLEDIAKAAKVGIATLYRHFPSREALLAAALELKDRVLLESAAHVRAMDDPRLALSTWLRALQEYLTTFGGLQSPILSAVDEPSSPLAITCDCLLSITRDLLLAAQARGMVRKDVSAKQLFQCALGLSWAFAKTCSDEQTRSGVMHILECGYLA